MSPSHEVLSKPPRCGRCRWWQGHRLYGDGSQTIAIAAEGLCSNPIPGLANQVFYFLSGAECPGFERNVPREAQPVTPAQGDSGE
jgi:hypothetical protein